MDFGIAKSTQAPGVTMVGTIAGTPEYMAPEQIRDCRVVGPPADQYGLGVTAYEMLTGTLPFEAYELVPLLMAHIQDPPKPLRQLVASLPEEIEQAVLKMLAKDPEQRFASCRSAAEHFERILVELELAAVTDAGGRPHKLSR